MLRHTVIALALFVAACEGCSGSHGHKACGRCWTGPAQARAGGCTAPSARRNNPPRRGRSGGQGGGSSGGGQCSGSHSHFACGRCWTSAAQASYGGCSQAGNGGGRSPARQPPARQPPASNNQPSQNLPPPSTCGKFNYNPQNTQVVRHVQGNSNAGGFNSDGLFVSVKGVVSNPCNTVEAIKDIERNLGIDIDDEFVAQSGYQGNVPPINPKMSKRDFIVYMKALFRGVNKNGKSGDQYATEFANRLDTNGDGILERNEASMAKGADPRQVLNLEPLFTINGGLATDDVMAYVGLYLGDGALDKYAGDMPRDIQDNMESFTRTWQPGVSKAGWSGN